MRMLISQTILTYTYINVFTDQGDAVMLQSAAVVAQEAPLHIDAFTQALQEYRDKFTALKKK